MVSRVKHLAGFTVSFAQWTSAGLSCLEFCGDTRYCLANRWGVRLG